MVRRFRDEVPGIATYVQVVDTIAKAEDIPGPDYETFLNSVTPLEAPCGLDSELDTITINYAPGTTGMPKGSVQGYCLDKNLSDYLSMNR